MNRTIIDQQSLDKFMEDDAELLADLSVIFVRYLPDAMARLNLAIENKDPSALRENAHQLKSKLSYFFCETLVNQVLELEDLGREGKVNDAAAIASELGLGIEELIKELNQLTGLNLSLDED